MATAPRRLFPDVLPTLHPPAHRDPLFGWIRALQDYALDVVGCRGTARRCEREFDELDAASDAEIMAGRRLVALIASRSTDPEIVHLADQALGHFDRGIAIDHQERTPLSRHWSLFDEACEAARQIVGCVERLLTPTRARRGPGGRER